MGLQRKRKMLGWFILMLFVRITNQMALHRQSWIQLSLKNEFQSLKSSKDVVLEHELERFEL